MGSVTILLASQALALAAPAPVQQGARVSAIATVEILHAETTRDEPGPQALVRHRRANADSRISIEFE
jgi:hypothetical protein